MAVKRQFSAEKSFIFLLIFCLKHKLWEQVRTVELPQHDEYHNLCVRAKIRKIMTIPVHSRFTNIKVWCEGVRVYCLQSV